jgi:hypothetical protein
MALRRLGKSRRIDNSSANATKAATTTTAWE